jgi:hypothetical protein
MAVAPGRALVEPGADLPFHIRFHRLQNSLSHRSQKIAVTRILQQLGQRQSLPGNRILSWQRLKLRNSTLADRDDGHRAYTTTRPRSWWRLGPAHKHPFQKRNSDEQPLQKTAQANSRMPAGLSIVVIGPGGQHSSG